MDTREPITHRLKIWPEYYQQHLAGDRPFEIRNNDRDFQVGDYVELWPYDPASNAYLNGDLLHYTIASMSTFQQRLNYVVLGLRRRDDVGEPRKPETLRDELASLINRRSLENRSNTPDFILASYIEGCLNLWDVHSEWKRKWFSPEGVPEDEQQNGPRFEPLPDRNLA